MKNIEEYLKRFPKVRSKLPPSYQKIYENEYKDNRNGIGFIGKLKLKLEDWMHIKIANLPKKNILEMGAGTLNHIKFEKNYSSYDIVEPMSFLYENSKFINNINNIYSSSKEIPKDKIYNNIISTAVFEHITDLPSELLRLTNRLNKDGIMQISIPTEGGFLWYLSWRFITGTSFYLKYKLDYKILMKYEHVNNAQEIEALIKFLFNNVKIIRFPFNLFHFSFYTYIEASDINYTSIKKLEQYLNE